MSNYQEKDTSTEFYDLFMKLFNHTKYNLQSLNKRFEAIDRCLDNIFLLDTNLPFQECEMEANWEDEFDDDITLKIIPKSKDYLIYGCLTEDKDNKIVSNSSTEKKSNSDDNEESANGQSNLKINKVVLYSDFIKMKQKDKSFPPTKYNSYGLVDKAIEKEGKDKKENSIENSSNRTEKDKTIEFISTKKLKEEILGNKRMRSEFE